MSVLELGCGNGALWTENLKEIPKDIKITLSDISDGMLRDTRRNISQNDERFSYESFDCQSIPFDNWSFDLVIANHLLFYCDDITKVCKQVLRVLKPGGRFICSTYGADHMKEISQLVQEFDSRIVLSAEKLYENFGLENGIDILKPFFPEITCHRYPDSIELNRPEPLIEYILSCHGNQNQMLLDRYAEFRAFVEKKTSHMLHITKNAGIFICSKV
jgi:SAM-dependent methyltransferase